MSSRKINRKAQRRLTICSLLLIAVMLGIVLTLPNYIIQIIDKYQEKEQLKNNLDNLKEEQEDLEKEVSQLSDAKYVAKIARQKYLFSKEGEIIIKVNDEESKKEEETKSNYHIEINSDYVIAGITALGLFIGFRKLKRQKRKTRKK